MLVPTEVRSQMPRASISGVRLASPSRSMRTAWSKLSELIADWS